MSETFDKRDDGWSGLWVRKSAVDAELASALSVAAELRAENERLREALKPFAEAAENLDESDHAVCALWENAAAMLLTAGDLRQARRAER